MRFEAWRGIFSQKEMNFHGQIIVAKYTKSTINEVAKKNSCMMRDKKKGKKVAKSMSCDFATLYDELSLCETQLAKSIESRFCDSV